MECKELFAIIDSLSEKYTDVLMRACTLESPTADKAAVDRCGSYFISLAKELGFDAYTEPMRVSADPVCIVMNGDVKERHLVFSGHIDTVHPIGAFGKDGIYIKDGELHAPGAYDCKGGCVAALMAMEALSLAGYRSRPIKLILQSDEENSSRTSNKQTVDFMERESRGCVAFLNCEPSMTGEVTLTRKGIIRYEITVHGVAGHSSKCFNAKSAVLEAAHKIIEFEKWKDMDGITCNCGVISGGTVANTVPEYCTFIIDIRYADGEQYKAVRERVSEIVSTSYTGGTTASARVISERVAMEKKEINERLVDEINRIYSKTGLAAVRAVSRAAGSDASDMTFRGIVALDGFGTEGGYIHSVNEYTRVDSIAAAAKRLAAIALLINDEF